MDRIEKAETELLDDFIKQKAEQKRKELQKDLARVFNIQHKEIMRRYDRSINK